MRKKILVLVVLFAFGLTGMAMAVPYDDYDDDAVVTGFDIASVNLEYIPHSLANPASPTEYWARMTVDMGAGQKVPAIIALEMDVDDDISTGGTLGMSGISVFPACGTLAGTSTTLKVQPGLDMLLILVLRDQGATSSTAMAADCVNGIESCAMGRMKAEMYISPGAATGMADTLRGGIEVSLLQATNMVADGPITLIFDYTNAVKKTYAALAGNAKQFDLAKGLDPATNLKYQTSTWFSHFYMDNGEDFLNTASFCSEVTDIVPSSSGGLAVAGLGELVGAGGCDTKTCTADFAQLGSPEPDGLVNVFDLLALKLQYGSSGCVTTCN